MFLSKPLIIIFDKKHSKLEERYKMKEELGVADKCILLGLVEYSYKGKKRRLHAFLITDIEKVKIRNLLPQEGIHIWVDLAKAREILHLEASREIVEMAQNFLRR